MSKQSEWWVCRPCSLADGVTRRHKPGTVCKRSGVKNRNTPDLERSSRLGDDQLESEMRKRRQKMFNRLFNLTSCERDEVAQTLAENDPCTKERLEDCLLYTSPSPRDRTRSRMPSSA